MIDPFLLDFARISHPFAPKNTDLRGQIGNVFASDRKKFLIQTKTKQSIFEHTHTNETSDNTQSGFDHADDSVGDIDE